MPSHDIIDNRSTKLVDKINRILDSTDRARFAVGYFFLSGFTALSDKLSKTKEIRLLIGNTTNRETLEQIAEGYRRLEFVNDAIEEEKYPKRALSKQMAHETVNNVREVIECMDQTDDDERFVQTLVSLIEEKRLKVRVYTKGRLHAKAYIFDYGKVYDESGKQVQRQENGLAIVGSSNLSLAGVSHNTELNVLVHGNQNHEELVKWFDELWHEAQDFDVILMNELKQSWAVVQATPYDIYMKTLYALVRDRLEGDDRSELMYDDEIINKLADFQKVAVHQAKQMIRDYGGAFVSDVVGLGKSFIGSAIIKHFERSEHLRPLILCPAALVNMWEHYNERYQLNARVLSLGYLQEGRNRDYNILLEDAKFRDRNFVLVDESHNFRHSDTQRYKILQSFLSHGKRSCFLTATPRNKSAMDIYHQIKLFHQEEITNLPIDPPNLREYFRKIDQGEKKLEDLLPHILIRRTRNHILRWYGYDADTHKPIDPNSFRDYASGKKKAYILVGGRHQFFPKRELETIEYSIEETYQGLYQKIRKHIGSKKGARIKTPIDDELTYARYGLWNYVKKEKRRKEPYVSLQRAGANLRGLMRILLFKRFESSVYAFKMSIEKLIKIHERYIKALDDGIVPAGEEAQQLIYEESDYLESDFLDALREQSEKYNIEDFEAENLKEHIQHDITLFKQILNLVKPILPEKDVKLQTLLSSLKLSPLNKGKKLIFTQYADTARYLYENLNPDGKNIEIDVIYSGDKSKERVVARFAPKANPEYQRHPGDTEINMLVSTDVLAEGLNLQDCDKIINYDLHWNPVRLIQRFGRIDRIGSDYDVIYAYNFLPEIGIEKNIHLKEKLHNRIQEIHDTIGEDTYILDRTERLNEEALYAIYEKKGQQLDLFEEGDDIIDLNEAEELFRQLRTENPDEFERIVNIRDGIRSGKSSSAKGSFVFCEAGNYKQLFLVDDKGEVSSRDVTSTLLKIKCSKAEPSLNIPKGFNTQIMTIKSMFSEEVKHRQSELSYSLSLTQAQRYVLRELNILFRNVEDEDEKSIINVLEQAFRGSITKAINRELNTLRRNGITGKELLEMLRKIYVTHNMREMTDRKANKEEKPVVKIVCSEALL